MKKKLVSTAFLSTLFLSACSSSTSPSTSSSKGLSSSISSSASTSTQVCHVAKEGLCIEHSETASKCSSLQGELLDSCPTANLKETCSFQSLTLRIYSSSQTTETCENTIKKIISEDNSENSIANEAKLTPTVKNDTAYINGLIYTGAIDTLKSLAKNYPAVKTLVFQQMSGSANDDAMLKAARYLRSQKWNTHLPANGSIASGAVDLFLAGTKRTMIEGGTFLVHSWGDSNGKSGSDYPKEYKGHNLYLDYYKEMGIISDFYWFTLKAAPASSVHIMTKEEIAKYGILTH